MQGYGREKLGFETILVKVTAGTQLELENYDDHFIFGLFGPLYVCMHLCRLEDTVGCRVQKHNLLPFVAILSLFWSSPIILLG